MYIYQQITFTVILKFTKFYLSTNRNDHDDQFKQADLFQNSSLVIQLCVAFPVRSNNLMVYKYKSWY